ncbi:NAD(P)/FAD-dependent oxidoreductase [Amycolatopsis lurida]
MSLGGHLLVVGAGQAGAQLVSSARELGWDGPITLVGQEPHAPYQRPPLSKAFLSGQASADSLALRTAAFYAAQQVDLVLGEEIEQLELTGGGAGTARSTSGRQWKFDRLALATGARPRRLPIDGGDLDGVVTLRTIHDAELLASRLAKVTDLVVLGGGFIGLEAAATAVESGVRTTVVEAQPTLMNRVVSPTTAQIVAAAHRAAGMRVLTGQRPRRLLVGPDGAVKAVELEDGAELPAQLVVVGVGAEPCDGLARAAGLRCDNGIVVDTCSIASDGHTLAIGDCASLPDPSAAPGVTPRLRLESVDNAVEQAKAAATTLVGNPRPYRSAPWFWSNQGDLKLQLAGLARADDDHVVRPSARPGRSTVLRYRGENLVAAECVNNPAEFMVLRKALGIGATLPRELATDADRPLKELLTARASEVTR